ncbi:hypothetical protein [Clostridium sp.]
MDKSKKEQIDRLEKSLQCLKEKLLQDRPEQYKAMASGYIRQIEELRR